MYRLVRKSIFMACLLLVQVSTILADTPQRFTAQGILTDGTSNPVVDGMYALILTGWDDSLGGSLLWTENKSVQTHGGLFLVELDGAAPAALLSLSGQQYIQVQVSGQAPMTPRIRVGSVPSALLTTRMDGDISTEPGAIVMSPPGGDPDFDLLRITAADSTASIAMGGDPDFDLLRFTAHPQTGSNIVILGDPDFDLLRITGVDSTGTVAIGDPDFDLLRMTANPSGSSLAIGGDPDFDLLRISGGSTGASMVMQGDPDFDLLRITAVDSTTNVAIGDPDFDLLRMTASPTASSLAIGDPDFDLLRLTSDNTGGSIAIDEEGVQVVKLHGGGGGGGGSGGGIAIGEEGVQVVKINSDSGGSSIAIDEEGVQRMLIHSDSGGTGIAVNEEGIEFSLSSDSAYLMIEIAETTTGSDQMVIGNDLDGDGHDDVFGIAVNEGGINERVHLSGGDGQATLRLNGLPPGTPVGGTISLDVDSTGGSIAIEEEGVQVVRMQSGLGGGGGGHGGGSIAIGEEGVQIVRIASDSMGSVLSVESGGVARAVLTVNAARKTYNYMDVFPCGVRDVEVGTLGLTMSCTPGGSTTPDTAVYIDPEGDMMLAGDLSVGGDICAVGTIGVCSDARYKTDVEALQGALASLGRIRGVNFNWRTEEFSEKGFRTGRDFGFIAQELKEVVPQVVTLGKDGYYSVDYGRLTPLLVEAVKELEARLASVEAARQAEVTVLTERLARLEAQFAKLAEGTSTAALDLTLADTK